MVKNQQKARKRLRIPYMYFLNPCHRCHLAKLSNNQLITGDKSEKSLPLVAANRYFWVDRRHPDKAWEASRCIILGKGIICPTLWDNVFHPME